MLVGEGAADDEGGGGSAPGSAYLRLVSVLGREACGGVAAATGGGGQSGGTHGRLRLVGLLRLDSVQIVVPYTAMCVNVVYISIRWATIPSPTQPRRSSSRILALATGRRHVALKGRSWT